MTTYQEAFKQFVEVTSAIVDLKQSRYGMATKPTTVRFFEKFKDLLKKSKDDYESFKPEVVMAAGRSKAILMKAELDDDAWMNANVYIQPTESKFSTISAALQTKAKEYRIFISSFYKEVTDIRESIMKLSLKDHNKMDAMAEDLAMVDKYQIATLRLFSSVVDGEYRDKIDARIKSLEAGIGLKEGGKVNIEAGPASLLNGVVDMLSKAVPGGNSAQMQATMKKAMSMLTNGNNIQDLVEDLGKKTSGRRFRRIGDLCDIVKNSKFGKMAIPTEVVAAAGGSTDGDDAGEEETE